MLFQVEIQGIPGMMSGKNWDACIDFFPIREDWFTIASLELPWTLCTAMAGTCLFFLSFIEDRGGGLNIPEISILGIPSDHHLQTLYMWFTWEKGLHWNTSCPRIGLALSAFLFKMEGVLVLLDKLLVVNRRIESACQVEPPIRQGLSVK